MNHKWQMHRAGLLNFWYYDEEEFYFADGKLLLRGNNGSGKSVTMQSFIPVLLDGRKSPDRLDPFGSRARRMEDYLLGEKGVVDRDERTGYLFLEYKRKGLEQYFTTGIGLRARRNSPLDFWGFIILDNRRIGKDLLLYKSEGSLDKVEKIPLTRIELENRLAGGGKVVRTAKEYMHLVNKHIFGFEEMADFEELIKLLIQLRSPKLSKDFKPTVIYEILNESLPGLSEEELKPLSETIENMDQTQQQIEQLMKEQKALQRLCRQYNDYNQLVLLEKAEGFLKIHTELYRFYVEEKELAKQLAESKEARDRFALQKDELQRENTVLLEEKSKLEKHVVFDAEQEKINLEQRHTTVKIQQGVKKESLEKGIATERSLKQKINGEEERLLDLETQIQDWLEELDQVAEEAKFFNHSLAREEFSGKYQAAGFAFDLWKREAEDYRLKLGTVLKTVEKLDKVHLDYKEADKDLGESRKRADLNDIELKKWATLFESEKEKLLKDIYLWLEEVEELKISDFDLQGLSRICQNLFGEYTWEDLKGIVDQAYLSCSRLLDQGLAAIGQQLVVNQQQIGAKEGEIAQWKSKQDPEPARHSETVSAPPYLRAKGATGECHNSNGYLGCFDRTRKTFKRCSPVRQNIDT
ncbi:MAG: hypothetical protein WDA53_06270 [Bacillota bacterium]